MSSDAKPPYPYDKRTEKISLPGHVQEEIRRLVKAGKKLEAIQRVLHLTGAGLKVSKDYVDQVQRELGK